MKSDSLIFPKPTVEEVYERITPFVEDTHFEANMEAEIDARKQSYYALRSHLDAQNPDYDAILEMIGADPEMLGTIISMLGLSQEEFYRYVTLIRVAQGEAFTSEWKLQTIARQMRADVQLGRYVLQLLFYGKEGHPLSDKLPVSARRRLTIRKLMLEESEVVDTLIRRGLKGRYDAGKGKVVEREIESVLKQIGVVYEKGDVTVSGVSRRMDFVVPTATEPHTFIESGVFVTTARELSEKVLVEAQVAENMRELYPNAVIVRVLDGIGWMARGGDALPGVIRQSDYILTTSELAEKLEPIVRAHVPENFIHPLATG